MTTRARSVHAAAMLLAALAFFLCSSAMKAQATRGPLAISNNLACDVEVCSADGATCVIVPAGTSRTIDIPCNTTEIGIRSCGHLVKLQLWDCADLRIGTCCTHVCFTTGIVACTFFLTFHPGPTPCLCPTE